MTKQEREAIELAALMLGMYSDHRPREAAATLRSFLEANPEEPATEEPAAPGERSASK